MSDIYSSLLIGHCSVAYSLASLCGNQHLKYRYSSLVKCDILEHAQC